MSNASAKTFDAVHVVRLVRDDVSSTIATMSVEEENRWLRSTEISDPTLRRLMELAAQQGAAADAASRHG
ncbi:MAG: hypothetical protein A3H96_12195 [Acidobacteria bacterium RIFCSPLOWO2_02_FULL_67_36]|nr:MAG: hypothetical protein A3H96_12195 [Acidobacteria bacterium RIFCSPLOWO2_02_FULL_67_36]